MSVSAARCKIYALDADLYCTNSRRGSGNARMTRLSRFLVISRWATSRMSAPAIMEAKRQRTSAKCTRPSWSMTPSRCTNLIITYFRITWPWKPSGGSMFSNSSGSFVVGIKCCPLGARRAHASTKLSKFASEILIDGSESSSSELFSKSFSMMTAMKRLTKTKEPMIMNDGKKMTATTVLPHLASCGGSAQRAPLKQSCMMPFQASPVLMPNSTAIAT
mmetsp:Transcript_153932/g.286897  ORF Transcript_153932/g.286897 Transcript_153932/m.286897 type:complete len:219 (-) Transcript_153932:407-1063(-)